MKYSQSDYDNLVAVVGESLDNPHLALRDQVEKAFEPFREPKPARIRSHIGNDDVFRFVELTDAVKARLGPTAGVNPEYIMNKLLEQQDANQGEYDFICKNIMKLIADAAPEIEGEL